MDKILNSYVKNFCDEFGISDDLFLSYSIFQICKNYELSTEQITDSYTENGGDGGFDSILLFLNKKYINSFEEYKEYSQSITDTSTLDLFFIQSKEVKGIKSDSFMKMKDTITKLLLEDIKDIYRKEFNANLISKLELINEIVIAISPKTKNISFNICYSYCGKFDEHSISVITQSQMDDIKNIIVEKTYIDKSNTNINIFDSCSLINLGHKQAKKDIILKHNNSFKTKYNSEVENGYIMSVNLKDYYNFITDDNNILDNLFEGNIRDFEGVSVEVNSKITSTLENDNLVDFWWLNNGITIIADDYVPLPNDKGKLTNPVIVNGLQTSYTIYNFYKNNLERLECEVRNIILRVIITKEINSSDKIISATNRQTPVKPAQLRATDTIQKDIEQVFLSKNIFYERRKNYYKNRDKDKNKIITLESLAQYLESIYYGNCSTARNNPTSLLKSDKIYNKLFNKDIDIGIYFCIAKFSMAMNNILKEIKKENLDPFKIEFSVSLDIFKFYIMRITCLKITNYNVFDEYQKLENFQLDKDFVLISINDLINKIKENFDTANIINVSKSKDLDSVVNEKDYITTI